MKSCFLSTARVGLIGPTGTFFSIFLEKSVFFSKNILYILFTKKKSYKKKKISDRPTGFYFYHPVDRKRSFI